MCLRKGHKKHYFNWTKLDRKLRVYFLQINLNTEITLTVIYKEFYQILTTLISHPQKGVEFIKTKDMSGIEE